MQFKNLDEKGYKRVCEFIAERATWVTTDKEGATIIRSEVKLYFMFGMLHQVIIEKNFADFCMGTRPFCNIRVALKVDNWNELVELYKATMAIRRRDPIA